MFLLKPHMVLPDCELYKTWGCSCNLKNSTWSTSGSVSQLCQAWWYMPATPVVGSVKLGDQKLRSSSCRSQRVRMPGEHSPQNQPSRARRGSQRLKQPFRSLRGSAVGPLQICYGCVVWCSCGTSSSGNRGRLWLFCQLLGDSSSYRVASSSPDKRISAWSYGHLLSFV